MVRDEIWPFLRERGFKRSKGTFHRAAGPNWQVVNLQKSQYSDRDAVTFTINLGVAYVELRRPGFGWAEGKRPPEYACQFRQRLGTLLRGRDTWWDVEAGMDTAALADALTEALQRYAMPWLDARSTDEGVLALMSDAESRSAEHTHHLASFRALVDRLGRDDLHVAINEEIDRKDASLEARRRLEGD